ncbi:hypothetical protein MMC07_008098 [Pseudocyphellaria aurata]|nr:hypothetical protein [Pseudocyphellaria aurata]
MARDHENLDLHVVDGRGYMLDNSYAGAARLNLQYYLWRESLRFNIHPSIPKPGQDAHIADVATGTAVWLAEVALELPDVQVHGFDIDLTKAPPKEWLPANTQLRHWNILDDTPKDLRGKYDIVHVRLLVLVVENSDPRPTIRNLAKDDIDYPSTHVQKVDKSLETPALHEFRETMYSRGRNDWPLQLDTIVSEEGFKDAKLHHFADRLDLARAHSEVLFLTLKEVALRLDQADRKDEASKIYHLVQAAYRESLRGAVIVMSKSVCVARKAG